MSVIGTGRFGSGGSVSLTGNDCFITYSPAFKSLLKFNTSSRND